MHQKAEHLDPLKLLLLAPAATAPTLLHCSGAFSLAEKPAVVPAEQPASAPAELPASVLAEAAEKALQEETLDVLSLCCCPSNCPNHQSPRLHASS